MRQIRTSRRASVAAGLALVAALCGCTAPTPATGSTVTVASAQNFVSYNQKTTFGDSTGNANIVSAANSQFASYDSVPKLVEDRSFGRFRVLSREPFTVTFTINRGVRWSDGTRVDAADLLLAWAANSGALNSKGFDGSGYIDPRSGQYAKPLPPGVVRFDGSDDHGLHLVTKTPVIGDGGRSLTLSYDAPFVDWRLNFGVGVAAHVVAGHALNIADAGRAKAAMITAIQSDDTARLAKIAAFWNTGFNFTSLPADRSLVLSDGPYTLTELVAGDHLTLTANRRYRGAHRPRFEHVVVRFISDPLAALDAFRRGEVDVVAPQPSADVTARLLKIAGATVVSGSDAAFEHLDLRFGHSRNGTFDSLLVRRAFLATVPRKQILERLVTPLQEDAQLRDSQVFVPGSPQYAEAVKRNGSVAFDEVDIPAATALLAQAGVANPPVCIAFDRSNERRAAEFAMIKASAALAGFVVTDCSTADQAKPLGVAGGYDASLTAIRPASLGVSATTAPFRSDLGGGNPSFYSNPTVDSLSARLDASFEPGERTAPLTEIDSRLWGDAYGVPLYQLPAVAAFDRRVRGVAPSPLTPNLLWNIWAWRPVVPSK